MYSPKSNCIKPALVLVYILFFCVCSYAQVIKGTVTDVNTGEPLLGATVLLKEAGKKQLVPLDGTFSFKNVTPGSYELVISYVNYNTRSQPVTAYSRHVTEIKVSLEPKITELYSILVVGGGADADRSLRAREKNANQLVNIVSAKNIELLPDITVANVMQRVSGVTIEKNSSGEARYPIIRGMEKRYINTLVNGIKIPSPDNKSRFIPLDLFPTELLERLEISKSLTPSMEGDAIGGTINLVMKDAPVNKLMQVNFSKGYNNIFKQQSFIQFPHAGINKQSPSEINGRNYEASPGDFPVSNLNYAALNNPVNTTAGITIGNRFGKGKKLGILLSGSYQNIFSGTRSTFFLPNAQPGLDNIPQFIDLYSRWYSTQNQRLGVNAKFDYKINQHNKISWFNTYVQLNMYQTRQSFDTVALNSLVDESYRSTWQYQSIYNSTIQGVHQLTPSWVFDWSAGYSIANNHMPDQAQFTHEYPVLVTGSGKVTKGSPDILSGMSRAWLHNSDKDLSAYINLTKQMRLLNRAFELKFGGLIRDKKRDNFYNSYALNPQLPAGSSVQLFTHIYDAVYTFKGSNAVAALNGNNYTFDEDVAAGYVQGKWQLLNRLEVLGGVRVENTHQQYNTELGPEVDARTGKISYTDVLPSAQIKYLLGINRLVRLSYYKALARPQFAELIPDGPDNYETFKEKGNPATLNHSLADNFDLRYESFHGVADQLLLGVFYKRIKDPIEYTAVKVGVTSQNLIPTNIGTATNYGFEAVFTKYFGEFGISANYTYTQSKVTNDSMLYSYRNDAGIRTSKYVSETRPLQGQANHVGNLSLIYKSHRIGFDAQLAFVYTGERISLVSPYAGLHYWQQPYKGLDLSFEKRIIKRLTFYTKINNLTNSPAIGSLHMPYNTYIASSGSRPLSLQTDADKKIIVQKDYVRTSFLFGLRFKY